MQPFEPNDYRKRVLAEVERRGGIEHSDPFELYDIPLDEAETLSDAEVSARVADVWGFWQRQRDHPKYRVLAGLLVDAHGELSRSLLEANLRRATAARVREARAGRDAGRYEMLDTAISRLVQRYGGVPAEKVPGLEEIGKMGGLSPAEVATRLRRHRIIDAPPVRSPELLTDQRRRQIKQLLTEWQRLVDGPPTPTLFALLGVDAARATQTGEIRLRAEALRSRSRELPPGRVRVVLDELLIHVQDLLEPGGDAVREYLRAIVEDAADELRPKVRAAVLVEDQLVGDDFDYLVDEAIELGLDRADAVRVVTDLATEAGARVAGSGGAAPVRDRQTGQQPPVTGGPAPSRPWEAPLKAARAALRAGHPAEAARQIAQARAMVGPNGDGLTPIRSVADEVDRVLAEAGSRWRAANSACAGKRYHEALGHLEYLHRSASDVPNPHGPTLEQLLTAAREATAEADRLVAAAPAAPPEARLRALLAALALCADHPTATAELAAVPVGPPERVRATRMSNGSILVAWSPSSTADVDYRVTRLQPDGSWRTVGRTRATELEDGGAPPTGAPPAYAVVAGIAGRYSAEARSDAPPPAAAHAPASAAVPHTASAGHTAAAGHTTAAPHAEATARSATGAHAGTATDPATEARAAASTAAHPHAAPGTAGAPVPHSGAAAHAASPVLPPNRDEPMPDGIPVVSALAEQAGLLTFTWPPGITEVMIVARADHPPTAPDDPGARTWKLTNTRYQIDGGLRLPPDLPRPCHLAIASCRRAPNGTLTVATAFAPTARYHWTH